MVGRTNVVIGNIGNNGYSNTATGTATIPANSYADVSVGFVPKVFIAVICSDAAMSQHKATLFYNSETSASEYSVYSGTGSSTATIPSSNGIYSVGTTVRITTASPTNRYVRWIAVG